MINHNTCEVFFDNLEVPAENLIGEEGQGFKLHRRQHERRAHPDRLGMPRRRASSSSAAPPTTPRSASCSAGRSARTRAWRSRSRGRMPRLVAAELMVRKALRAVRGRARLRRGGQHGQDAGGRRGLEGGGGLPADLRRLRLRARVRHRAQVARDAAVPDRADLHQHGAGLRRPARARACRARIEDPSFPPSEAQ